MKYDDSDWHYGGIFPEDLPPGNGGNHIALFITWMAQNNLVGELHLEEGPYEDLQRVLRREMNPRDYLLKWCDEKLTDDDLNEEGNLFATDYYANGTYLRDYGKVFGNEVPDLYYVECIWENYDRIARVIDDRYQSRFSKR